MIVTEVRCVIVPAVPEKVASDVVVELSAMLNPAPEREKMSALEIAATDTKVSVNNARIIKKPTV